MTHDASFFKEINQSYFFKVSFGNGESVDVKGKWVVIVETPLGTKYILDVLISLVLELSQSFFSVKQMLQRNYALHFKNIRCTIFDP